MKDSTRARLAAAALAGAAALAAAGFTALGSVFRYPAILGEPPADVLALFREHHGAVTIWFALLAAGAALLAPAGIWLGRIAGGRIGRSIAGLGVAAAAVQVIGLQRWVTLVPGISRDALDPALRAAAEERFARWHFLLGTIVGETVGYALTAAFTLVLVAGLRGRLLPRLLGSAGVLAAVLIATGVAVPFAGAASLTNFAGYVLWCVWLLAVAGVLARTSAMRVSSAR